MDEIVVRSASVIAARMRAVWGRSFRPGNLFLDDTKSLLSLFQPYFYLVVFDEFQDRNFSVNIQVGYPNRFIWKVYIDRLMLFSAIKKRHHNVI